MAGVTIVGNGPVNPCHPQSATPAEEILDGGSIYWIIKGVMSARQNIIDLAEIQRADGQVACGLVLSSDLVATVPTKMRIFQGWRYLGQMTHQQI